MKKFPILYLLICLASFCFIMGIQDTYQWESYWDYAENCCNCNDYPFWWIYYYFIIGLIVFLCSGFLFVYDIITNRKKIFGKENKK